MFEFAYPWFALFLPSPWLLKWWLGGTSAAKRATKGDFVLLNPGVSRLKEAFETTRCPDRLRWESLWELLWALLWIALVVALMGPQRLERHTEVVSHGHDLMLAVDISRSMEALDFELNGRRMNRLAVVKGVVGQFIAQRPQDRIGLILFGDAAYLQTPLTLDGGAVRAMLDEVVPRMAGDATAIGDAVGLAVKKLRQQPAGGRVVILLTDGENTAGALPPLEAAVLARRYGVRIYTVGVGTRSEVPVLEGGELTMKTMPLDETLLSAIADTTGGGYFRATDTAALRAIYRHIDGLERTEAVTRSTFVPQPLFRWPLGVAGAALLAMAMLSITRRASLASR